MARTRKNAPPRDDEIKTYPFAVLRAGERGKQLYDALLRELTMGDDAVSPEVAEFMIQHDWPDLAQALAEGHIDLNDVTE